MQNKKGIALLLALLLLFSQALAQYETLEQGTTGEDVRRMQEALKSLGYTVTIDGNFGRGTLKAILQFQKKQGLTADGKAGNSTLQKLYALAGKTASSQSAGNSQDTGTLQGALRSVVLPLASLRLGDVGQSVQEMQTALKQLGYMRGTPDGKFGQATEKALKAFQKKYKLTQDGVAGDSTLRLLYAKCNVTVSGKVLSQEEIAKQSGRAEQTNNINPVPTAVPQGKENLTETTLPGQALLFGEKSDAVRHMQIALNKIGFYVGTVDGVFGESTQTALKAFQKKNKLAQDGVAGRTTLKTLYRKAKIKAIETPYTAQNAAPTATALVTPASQTRNILAENTPVPKVRKALISNVLLPNTSLRKGDNSTDVRNLQLALNQLGYKTNGTDGKFGDATETAVKQFQVDYKITADGVAGQATLNLLYTKAGVRIDGIVSNTNAQATAVPAVQPNVPSTLTSYNIGELYPGNSGASVSTMQVALKQLGFYTGSINASYDSNTQNAVKALQKKYGLSVDGVAGAMTQRAIADLIAGKNPSAPKVENLTPSTPTFQAPGVGEVRLLHWYNEVKNTMSTGNTVQVYDPETGVGYTLRVMSRGRHLDAEPLTAKDTEEMFKAFGGRETWTPNNVYVRLPNGAWTLATTHNVAHSPQTIKDNNFNGHLCVHFLRDLSETQSIDPNYGMQNQRAIRIAWKNMTGQVID